MRGWAELHAETACLYLAAPLHSRDTVLLEQLESSRARSGLSPMSSASCDELDELGARLVGRDGGNTWSSNMSPERTQGTHVVASRKRAEPERRLRRGCGVDVPPAAGGPGSRAPDRPGRRAPTDIVFVDPADGTPASFISDRDSS